MNIQNSVDIKLPDGSLKEVKIQLFPAMEGWILQNRFIDFAMSKDGAEKRQYVFDVLAYAKIASGNNDIPLATGALIDNHLQTWQNIETVFEAILMANGIDPKTHADKPDYWIEAGSMMALAFFSEASKLMGPALYQMEKKEG